MSTHHCSSPQWTANTSLVAAHSWICWRTWRSGILSQRWCTELGSSHISSWTRVQKSDQPRRGARIRIWTLLWRCLSRCALGTSGTGRKAHRCKSLHGCPSLRNYVKIKLRSRLTWTPKLLSDSKLLYLPPSKLYLRNLSGWVKARSLSYCSARVKAPLQLTGRATATTENCLNYQYLRSTYSGLIRHRSVFGAFDSLMIAYAGCPLRSSRYYLTRLTTKTFLLPSPLPPWTKRQSHKDPKWSTALKFFGIGPYPLLKLFHPAKTSYLEDHSRLDHYSCVFFLFNLLTTWLYPSKFPFVWLGSLLYQSQLKTFFEYFVISMRRLKNCRTSWPKSLKSGFQQL